jgi:hypothetical protein
VESLEIVTGPVQIKATASWYNSFVVIDFRSYFSLEEEREKLFALILQVAFNRYRFRSSEASQAGVQGRVP